MDDGIRRLEHDHVPLSRLVDHLRDVLAAVARGDTSAGDAYGTLADGVHQVHSELLDHFAREEEGLFPFLSRELPPVAGDVARLAAEHDTICGGAARLAHLVGKGPESLAEQLPTLTAQFARFDAAYVQHAREERALLRRLDTELTGAQREAVATLLRGL